MRPNSAVFRDFDPDKPMVHLQGVAASTAPFSPSPSDLARTAAAVTANAASAVARDTASSASTEAFDALATMHVYEHHNPILFPKWETASEEAPLLLRQKASTRVAGFRRGRLP